MGVGPQQPWLLPFLKEIRHSPSFYLCRADIGTLLMYLDGYEQARVDLGVPPYGDGEETLLHDFGMWLGRKYREEGIRTRWMEAIEVLDESPTNLTRFFEEFELFLNDRGMSLSDPNIGKCLRYSDVRTMPGDP